jgi:beta-lactam-binding protein with PASTA domain
MQTSMVFLLSFLTSVVTASGTVYVIERYGVLPPRAEPAREPETIVPSFEGLSEADARANATAARLALLVSAREPSPGTKPGTVLRQSLPAGQRVPREHPVSVVLSEEVPKVPSVLGLTLPEATEKLKQAGYTLKVGDAVAHESVPKDAVVSQDPNPDAEVKKGETVTVQLSSGPGEAAVPKLVGFPIGKAQKELEKLGFKPTVRWVELAETPTMVVLSQKPAAGEKVKPGSEVQLTVCR